MVLPTDVPEPGELADPSLGVKLDFDPGDEAPDVEDMPSEVNDDEDEEDD